jgi:hypothetical protein
VPSAVIPLATNRNPARAADPVTNVVLVRLERLLI